MTRFGRVASRTIRSERAAAVLLLAAAAAGLLAANSPIGAALIAAQDAHLAIPGTVIDLSLGHWISDGLLAVFFFVVAVELRHEFTAGQLDTVSKAVRPAIAALGGVFVPAALYLAATAGSGFERGWPIPTATDIAFALGVLAVFGKGLPSRLRIFILALAILDDIVAILIIAFFFTDDADLLLLAAAAACVVGFGLLARLLRTRFRAVVIASLVILAVLAWSLVLLAGVHATIAGVALGLVMAHKPASRVRHALEPVTNGVILPLFAFSAALVELPAVAVTDLAPPFWGILVALPLGKLIGIVLGGWLSGFVGPGPRRPPLTRAELAAAGALGGVGFTVSLLMNELAFARNPDVADEGTLAVLLGSGVSIALSAILVARLESRHRRLRPAL